MTDGDSELSKGAAKAALPALEDILLDRSLYDLMPVGEDDRRKLEALREDNFQLDAYCIYCKDRSIFKTRRAIARKPPVSISNSPNYSREPSVFDPGTFLCDVSCARCTGSYRYYFMLSKEGLSKIGQHPSLEDIGSSELLKYRKALPPEDYSELKRATGLIAHGIGIGSFVYLRRIFERLIRRHHEELASAGNSVEGFEALPMDKKIEALADVLPRALVAHRNVYGILSTGIHALDEATCKKYFPVVKSAILQILDQDIAAKEAKAAEERLQREIAAIAGEARRA